jgi:lambda repressor-like predicted transcriptional regulator
VTSFPTFATAFERSVYVQAELKLRGHSLASLARANGWRRGALYTALFQPSDPQEKVLAMALETTQEALFPERYASDGRRLHRIRDANSRNGSSTVKTELAA